MELDHINREADIEGRINMHNIKIAIAVAMLVASPALAQPSVQTPETILKVNGLSPRPVDHLGVRASELHWGMTASEAARIMGTPSGVDSYTSDDVNVCVLDFSDEPIPTKVTIVNNTVSGVALDVARVDDRTLPSFSQAAWVGMSRATVLKALGTAKGELRHRFFNVALDQLIFVRPGQSEVSVYLLDDRVIAKKLGRAVPDDILRVVLPSPHDDMAEDESEHVVRVGMTVAQVRALYGAPQFAVNSTFKGQPAEYAVFETEAAKSFGRFTFIDGVLTEFSVPDVSFSDIPWGG
jgi:outer membrane protein assembly factor BamE (lipoprotein component of BamABCDE complex)